MSFFLKSALQNDVKNCLMKDAWPKKLPEQRKCLAMQKQSTKTPTIAHVLNIIHYFFPWLFPARPKGRIVTDSSGRSLKTHKPKFYKSTKPRHSGKTLQVSLAHINSLLVLAELRDGRDSIVECWATWRPLLKQEGNVFLFIITLNVLHIITAA